MKYKNFLMLDRDMLASKFGISKQQVERIIFRNERYFASTRVKDKNILEIGAGSGLLSCLLSLAGAKSVTAIEPELTGSSKGMLEKFKQNVETFGLNNVTLIEKKLQDCELPSESFDLAVAIASVNHWDEETCTKLHEDENARKTYVSQFRWIWSSLTIGGQFVVTDLARLNLFSWVSNHWGIPNPLSPTIEWFKHQQPSLWAQFLKRAGFSQVNWKWLSLGLPNVTASKLLDSRVFNNAILAYLTLSKFVIWARK